MKTLNRLSLILALACGAAAASHAAELTLEGNRLLVQGMLDGSAAQTFVEHLNTGKVQTVVFEDSLGGTAEAAGLYAQAIRATGVNTEVRGQCYAACAYAFLAGKDHRFGRGPQVNVLLIPVGARPKASELTDRWRGDEAQKTLAEFTTTLNSSNAPQATTASAGSDESPPVDAGPVAVSTAGPKEKWQPEHGVVFMATPTLFGRVYNTYYCDGTQGRDVSRCELLSDADPRKLGVLTQ
ncbi:hypothetical protein QTI66_33740 [Variovorax sp. J22R133]|uniref:hypothetical protein n=1 Tax=Variovorax brevis TaxID=3053503 RepID=UPI00257685F7|nr:hypothetical protein [Variovorax sp. J22R133]MDM0117087.1 hypothetical protein [Variovorax sp. J22R133]